MAFYPCGEYQKNEIRCIFSYEFIVEMIRSRYGSRARGKKVGNNPYRRPKIKRVRFVKNRSRTIVGRFVFFEFDVSRNKFCRPHVERSRPGRIGRMLPSEPSVNDSNRPERTDHHRSSRGEGEMARTTVTDLWTCRDIRRFPLRNLTLAS